MPDLEGFISPLGEKYAWQYPYVGIAQGRHLYHARGVYHEEDWPMPDCPFLTRQESPTRRRESWADAQESRAESEQVRRLVRELGPAFWGRQTHLDPTRVGNVQELPSAGTSSDASRGPLFPTDRERRERRTEEELGMQQAIHSSTVSQGRPLDRGHPCAAESRPAAAGDPPGGAVANVGHWAHFRPGSKPPAECWHHRNRPRREDSRDDGAWGGRADSRK